MSGIVIKGINDLPDGRRCITYIVNGKELKVFDDPRFKNTNEEVKNDAANFNKSLSEHA